MNKDLQFKFFYNETKHPMVQEYFQIRDKAFKEQWNLKKFSGGEDSYDKNAYILIVLSNHKVVGGARFFISNKGNNLLPMETDSFKLSNLISDADLLNCKYAEISRVAIKDDLRQGVISTLIYEQLLCKKAPELNIKYVFCVTTMKLARSARIACKRIGINLEIQRDIEVPDLETYENLTMYVSKMDLNHFYENKNELLIEESVQI